MIVIHEYVGLAWLERKEFDTLDEAQDYLLEQALDMNFMEEESYLFNTTIEEVND